MSSYCEACGRETDAWMTSHVPGSRGPVQRCPECYERRAPIDPKHIGKRSALDRLPLATTKEKP